MSIGDGTDPDNRREPVDISLMVQAVIWLIGISFIVYRLFSRGELGTESLYVTFGMLLVSWLIQGWKSRKDKR